MVEPPLPVISMQQALAEAKFTEDFRDIASACCIIATDGAGPTHKCPKFAMAGAGGATAFVTDTPEGRTAIDEINFFFSAVPGRQTVPRAETWAIITALKQLAEARTIACVVDAMYVVRGATSAYRKARRGGENTCRYRTCRSPRGL